MLTRLTEVGLIDDAAFAQAFVRSQHTQRGLARRAVAIKLRQRRVGDELVDAAVEEIDADSECAAARALVQRKMRSLAGLGAEAQTRRLLGLLARRGYSAALAGRVVRDVVHSSQPLPTEFADNGESADF